MTLGEVLLLTLELAEDFFSNYRRSFHWVMTQGQGVAVYDKRYRYAKKSLLKRGLLQSSFGNKTECLSELGREQILNKFPLLEWRKREWDGCWRVVMYDFPETYKNKRDVLRRFLKKLGFAQWQMSVWVSPHPVIEKIDVLLTKHDLRKYCSVHESRRVVGVSVKEFAQKIWKLENINDDYKRIIKSFDENKKLEYLEELMKDPFLPKELLPNDYLLESLMKKVLSTTN